MAAARHRIEAAALTGGSVPDPPRVAWRKQMRQRVLDAARDLTCEAGWDQVSLSAVAARAEVSRPSVYKEFGNRAGLGRALVVRETQQFLGGCGRHPLSRRARFPCLPPGGHPVRTSGRPTISPS
ncbi:TetR/AcrR family transcriptional regulator [Streptomyces spororaveus]|uniref:TetR/AcrR family transcriptional regulator n=1 Tax=Streptomyces spororaveus TaxID=284039 RepID=UPI003557E65C